MQFEIASSMFAFNIHHNDSFVPLRDVIMNIRNKKVFRIWHQIEPRSWNKSDFKVVFF